MSRFQRGKRMALRILSEHSIRKAPVDVEKVAKKYAHVIRDDLGGDVSGMLVPLREPIRGKRWAIVVHQDHSHVRQRFTIAHELGHLLLHDYNAPHADRGYSLRLRKTVRYRNAESSKGSVIEEIEANQFAADLLMPDRVILRELMRSRFEYAPQQDEGDAKVLRELASRFEVSQQALAIKISHFVM